MNVMMKDADTLRREAYETAHEAHPAEYVGKSPIKVNKLGHFVYEVSDVERTVKFWKEVMGFIETDRNAKGMVFFRCNADHHGIGLKPAPKGKPPRREMTKGLQMEHLAFEVDNIEVLKQARDYLQANGIPIVFQGRKGAGCNISVNFLDPDGFEFEVYCEMDQIGADNRLRPESQFRPADPLEEAIANPVPKTW